MKMQFLGTISLLFFSTFAIANEREKGDGWIDVKVAVVNTDSISNEKLVEANKFASVYARLAANLAVKFGSVPKFDLQYLNGEYIFKFVDPIDKKVKNIKWVDVLENNYIFY